MRICAALCPTFETMSRKCALIDEAVDALGRRCRPRLDRLRAKCAVIEDSPRRIRCRVCIVLQPLHTV